MERVVGFVDYGFLSKAAKVPLRAASVAPKAGGVVSWLRTIESDPTSFLRAYWYDGAYDPRHPRHNAQRKYFDMIAAEPGVQLRLGHLQETRPKWQHAVREALKAAELDLDKFEEHFTFRPTLGRRVSTRVSHSTSCVWHRTAPTT